MATLFCPRASCLRVVAHNVRPLTAPTASKAAFTTSARPLGQLRPSHETTQPQLPISSRIPTTRFVKSTPPRNASTIASTPSEVPQDLLTWDRFFDLRRKRRYISTGASVLTAIAAVGIGAPIINSQEIDTWGAQVSGMDPFIVLGISTFGVAILGWLCGPTFGNAGFGVWAARRGWKRAIAEKEKSFYARIRRYRADPSASSPQNPIPDYYGEKIASVKDYRRWLKDQRAFNRKKNRALL